MTTEQQQEETDIFEKLSHQFDYTQHCGVLQVDGKELNIYKTVENFMGNKYKWDLSGLIDLKVKKGELNSRDQWLNESMKGTIEESFWNKINIDKYIKIWGGFLSDSSGYWGDETKSKIGTSNNKYNKINIWIYNKGDTIGIPLYYNGFVKRLKFPRKHLTLIMRFFSIREVTEENMYESHGHHIRFYVSYGQHAVSIYDKRLDQLWKQGVLKFNNNFLNVPFRDQTIVENHFYIKDEIKHIVDQYISLNEVLLC